MERGVCVWVFMCVWRLCQAAGDTAGFIATTWVGEIIWILMPSLLPAALSDQDWVLGEAGCLGCQRAGLQLPPALYDTPPHTHTRECGCLLAEAVALQAHQNKAQGGTFLPPPDNCSSFRVGSRGILLMAQAGSTWPRTQQ